MNDSPWKAMGLVGAVGVDLGACLWIGYWLGSKLDAQLHHTMLWSLAGLGVGLLVGVWTVILLIKGVTGVDRQQ